MACQGERCATAVRKGFSPRELVGLRVVRLPPEAARPNPPRARPSHSDRARCDSRPLSQNAERSSPTGLTAATERAAPDAGVQAFSKLQLDEPRSGARAAARAAGREEPRGPLGPLLLAHEGPALLDVEPEPVPSGEVALASRLLRLGVGRRRSRAAIRHVPGNGARAAAAARARRERLDRAAAWARPRPSTGVPPAESSPALTPAPLDVGRAGAARAARSRRRSRSPPPPPPPRRRRAAVAVASRLVRPRRPRAAVAGAVEGGGQSS